jgi:nitroimidazol reductase NimA-like FMN-containing flavoprotein (pyridoxamine 5'-phosphate oxidase superfamily)
MTDHTTDPKAVVRRHDDRAAYDRETIDSILDEAIYCHVGFVDEGHPYVIPTIHVRVDDTLILHGSPASRMLRVLKAGAPASVAVTLLDGLVLARSVFNHSMNYRSVVLFGSASEITDPDAKLEAMRIFTDKILPGRWGEARVPSDKEFKGTLMLGIPIDTASAKLRTGPPVDEPEDVDLPVWAGVIPYSLAPGEPIPAPDMAPGIPFPETLRTLLED